MTNNGVCKPHENDNNNTRFCQQQVYGKCELPQLQGKHSTLYKICLLSKFLHSKKITLHTFHYKPAGPHNEMSWVVQLTY
jgi:hypothetical protein